MSLYIHTASQYCADVGICAAATAVGLANEIRCYSRGQSTVSYPRRHILWADCPLAVCRGVTSLVDEAGRAPVLIDVNLHQVHPFDALQHHHKMAIRRQGHVLRPYVLPFLAGASDQGCQEPALGAEHLNSMVVSISHEDVPVPVDANPHGMHELSVITPELSDDVFGFAVDVEYLETMVVIVRDDDVSRRRAGCHVVGIFELTSSLAAPFAKLLDELVVGVKDVHAVLAYVCNYDVVAVGDCYAMRLTFRTGFSFQAADRRLPTGQGLQHPHVSCVRRITLSHSDGNVAFRCDSDALVGGATLFIHVERRLLENLFARARQGKHGDCVVVVRDQYVVCFIHTDGDWVAQLFSLAGKLCQKPCLDRQRPFPIATASVYIQHCCHVHDHVAARDLSPLVSSGTFVAKELLAFDTAVSSRVVFFALPAGIAVLELLRAHHLEQGLEQAVVVQPVHSLLRQVADLGANWTEDAEQAVLALRAVLAGQMHQAVPTERVRARQRLGPIQHLLADLAGEELALDLADVFLCHRAACVAAHAVWHERRVKW